MIPEPLKGKIIMRIGEPPCYQTLYIKKNIVSAVEWLRKYINPRWDNPYYQEWVKWKDSKTKYQQRFLPKFRQWIINKAFEDVMKK